MTKDDILAAIRRTASENGGVPLGQRTFERETGIRYADWFGKFWRSWGDAVREAGFAPNTLTPKIEEEELLRRYSTFARELGRAPTKGDLRLKKRHDASFPSESAFIRRFNSFSGLRAKAAEYCLRYSALADVAPLLAARQKLSPSGSPTPAAGFQTGFVYLVKHGARPEYKIGKTLNPLRREGEIRLQLPGRLSPVHYIETDDPAGVEAYWHARFAAKRMEGEWFALTREDVAAFKRWKRIA